MRKHYEFSHGHPNPYARRLKRSVTIRIDETTLDYYKALATRLGIPYQTLINMYLRDCADRKLLPRFEWKPLRTKKSEK